MGPMADPRWNSVWDIAERGTRSGFFGDRPHTTRSWGPTSPPNPCVLPISLVRFHSSRCFPLSDSRGIILTTVARLSCDLNMQPLGGADLQASDEKFVEQEHIEQSLAQTSGDYQYEDADTEPELHARTWFAVLALFFLNYVQVFALTGPPAIVCCIISRVNFVDIATAGFYR